MAELNSLEELGASVTAAAEPAAPVHVRKVDDLGRSGGIAGSSFVIAGDLNADPVDGEAVEAIAQLLEHPRIRTVPVPRSRGALAASARQGGANGRQRGDPAADTGDFPDDGPGNLRLDYVLPSVDLEVVSSGVFWPAPDEPHSDLVEHSDHRMVWVDIGLR